MLEEVLQKLSITGKSFLPSSLKYMLTNCQESCPATGYNTEVSKSSEYSAKQTCSYSDSIRKSSSIIRENSLTLGKNNFFGKVPKHHLADISRERFKQLFDFDPEEDNDANSGILCIVSDEANFHNDTDEKRQHDREEIRRKLAMDSDSEDYYCGEKVTKKPSLSTRLQSGMNLQICFMNETASDQESQGSDHDTEISSDKEIAPPQSSVKENDHKTDISNKEKTISSTTLVESRNCSPASGTKRQRPSFFFSRPKSWNLRSSLKDGEEKNRKANLGEDFMTRHARLQAEARMALAQAKEMARMQMDIERRKKKKSPIADVVGIILPDGCHRLSRQLLTDMNLAQLQVIVNDLHTQIENLNEELVQLLLERDDLHMQQDSMLVDIEDLTRYLGAKNEALRNQQSIDQLGPTRSASK